MILKEKRGARPKTKYYVFREKYLHISKIIEALKNEGCDVNENRMRIRLNRHPQTCIEKCATLDNDEWREYMMATRANRWDDEYENKHINFQNLYLTKKIRCNHEISF